MLGEGSFWDSDKVAAEKLNSAFYRNTFTIGSGNLGNKLAWQRHTWDFSQHVLGNRGWLALQNLLPGAVNLVSLTLALNPKEGGAKFELEAGGGDTRSVFSTLLPGTLAHSFRSGRVVGVPTKCLRVRRLITKGRVSTPELW
jgi:hypothetical protein